MGVTEPTRDRAGDQQRGQHTEIEHKFEIAPDQPLPDLAGVGVVETVSAPESLVLDATYYDTAWRDLTRHGVSLRRRTGGGDAGWHLKLADPARPDHRTELRAALDEGRPGPHPEVPASFVSHLSPLTRGRSLEILTRIRTERTERQLLDAGGRLLAVLTDDRVHTHTPADGGVDLMSWRELEVELAEDADQGESLLHEIDRRLEAEGLSRSRWTSKVRHALAPSFEHAAVLAGRDDPEAPAMPDVLADKPRAAREV
jgi:hypothetical protein